MSFWGQIRHSVDSRRAARFALSTSVLGVLVAGAYYAVPAKSSSPAPAQADAPITEPSDHPTMSLDQLTVQITRDGQPRETITADWAQLDEAEHIMTLRNSQSHFYKDGKPSGEAHSGFARTFLKARPAENIGLHDMQLSDKVLVKMQDGTLLQSQQMNYSDGNQTLVSEVPYLKQTPLKNAFIVGNGDGFSIKLDAAKGTFVSWEEYGKPAVLKHSATPVLNP